MANKNLYLNRYISYGDYFNTNDNSYQLDLVFIQELGGR